MTAQEQKVTGRIVDVTASSMIALKQDQYVLWDTGSYTQEIEVKYMADLDGPRNYARRRVRMKHDSDEIF